MKKIKISFLLIIFLIILNINGISIGLKIIKPIIKNPIKSTLCCGIVYGGYQLNNFKKNLISDFYFILNHKMKTSSIPYPKKYSKSFSLKTLLKQKFIEQFRILRILNKYNYSQPVINPKIQIKKILNYIEYQENYIAELEKEKAELEREITLKIINNTNKNIHIKSIHEKPLNLNEILNSKHLVSFFKKPFLSIIKKI